MFDLVVLTVVHYSFICCASKLYIYARIRDTNWPVKNVLPLLHTVIHNSANYGNNCEYSMDSVCHLQLFIFVIHSSHLINDH